jgi:hypothetical protein
MMPLEGLFICENLQDIILKRGRLRGRVHSVFANACNIECDDLFMTLLSKGKKVAPMSVIVDHGGKVNFKDLNITQGLIFEFTESEICCREKNLVIDINNAKTCYLGAQWKSSNCSQHQLLENIKIIESGLKTHGKYQGMGPLINILVDKLPELELVKLQNYAFDTSIEFIRDRFIRYIHALIEADADDIGEISQLVIGFGCGLTPAMDDFISGVMVTYIYMGSYYKLNRQRIYAFNSKVISLGLIKTTRVSAEMLKHSSVGEANEAIHDLIAAILNFNNDNDAENHRIIISTLIEVIGYGETSGTDTALGIYLGLRILTNLKYRRVWINESLCRY